MTANPKNLKRMAKAMLVLGIACVLSACGRPPAPPLPPPPPQNPNPAPVVGSCGNVGGVQPFRNDNLPYFATLTNMQTGGTGNSLQLSLSFAQQGSIDMRFRNIVGSAQITLPDMNRLLGGYTPNYTFCVSSVIPGTSTPSPGTFDQRTGMVAISLYGQAQIPMYNPFGGYMGGYPGMPNQPAPQLTPVPVQVDVGNQMGCQAFLNNGRLQGCVIITLGVGQYSHPLIYQADWGMNGGMGPQGPMPQPWGY